MAVRVTSRRARGPTLAAPGAGGGSGYGTPGFGVKGKLLSRAQEDVLVAR
ncbi:MAG TPA: hypothetical protein VNM91_03075 [Dehalococcoidia bacterium]|nr:hypothetical protein [Dehalococcoidia bacterium]